MFISGGCSFGLLSSSLGSQIVMLVPRAILFAVSDERTVLHEFHQDTQQKYNVAWKSARGMPCCRSLVQISMAIDFGGTVLSKAHVEMNETAFDVYRASWQFCCTFETSLVGGTVLFVVNTHAQGNAFCP